MDAKCGAECEEEALDTVVEGDDSSLYSARKISIDKEETDMALQHSELGTHGATSREDFAATQKPLLEASMLPPDCYTSQEFYAREVERIFMKEWLCVGRVNEVEKPGDYYTLDIAGEPIVVVRDEQGKIRVLSRVCRHRGALVVEGEGNRRTFECHFHGWTYSLRGELIGAPQMEQTVGFAKARCGLPELKVEEWEGFVFINFDSQAEPLGPRLVGLAEKFKNYRLGEMQAAKQMVFQNACNWKLSVEQGIDTYHAPNTHPDSAHTYHIPRTIAEEGSNGMYTTAFTPMVRPHPYVTGTAMAESPFPAIEGLNDFELQSFNIFLVYPTLLVGCNPDGILYLLFVPQGVDQTEVRLNLCYLPSVMEQPDFEHNLKEAQKGFVDLNNQDMGGRGRCSGECRRGQRQRGDIPTWRRRPGMSTDT